MNFCARPWMSSKFSSKRNLILQHVLQAGLIWLASTSTIVMDLFCRWWVRSFLFVKQVGIQFFHAILRFYKFNIEWFCNWLLIESTSHLAGTSDGYSDDRTKKWNEKSVQHFNFMCGRWWTEANSIRVRQSPARHSKVSFSLSFNFVFLFRFPLFKSRFAQFQVEQAR